MVARAGGAESDAPGGDSVIPASSGPVVPDPALAQLIEAWPTLPEHIRGAIAALVNVATGPVDPTED